MGRVHFLGLSPVDFGKDVEQRLDVFISEVGTDWHCLFAISHIGGQAPIITTCGEGLGLWAREDGVLRRCGAAVMGAEHVAETGLVGLPERSDLFTNWSCRRSVYGKVHNEITIHNFM